MGLNVLWSRHNSFRTCLQTKRHFFLFHLLIVLKTPNAFRFFFFFSFQFTLRKLENNSSMFTKKNVVGPTEIWTRIAGFRVQRANHYTMGPFAWQITENGRAFFFKKTPLWHKCAATQSPWSRNAKFSASFLPKKIAWYKIYLSCF